MTQTATSTPQRPSLQWMPDATGRPTTFEQGQEVGRVAQILRDHERHFTKLNGSQEDVAKALIQLTGQINELREEARLRDERALTEKQVLAEETERRRSELAITADQLDREGVKSQFTFTSRTAVAAVAVTIALAVLGYLLA